MQPPGRISLFFVAAGSSPAGLFSVRRSLFGPSVSFRSVGLFSVSRSALLPAGLPFLQRPAFSVGWPAFVDRPVLLPAATISAAGLYSFSAGSLPSAALLCCRGVCFGAGFAGPVFDPFRFPPGLCRRTLCFVPGVSVLAPGPPVSSLAHSGSRPAPILSGRPSVGGSDPAAVSARAGSRAW